MNTEFTHTVLGRTGLRVHRLGFSASYRPGKRTVYRAVDAGLNLFFGFGLDTQLTSVMRDLLKDHRERYVIATGPYNFIWGYQNIRKTLEKRLRQFGTDYIDLFLFLGVMKEREFPPAALEEMRRLREEGKVRCIGMSCHDRRFAGRMASDGSLDVLMVRYNAAHRGAEKDIFPLLQPHNPAVISYTATRWTYLLRRPKRWPAEKPIPSPGMAYRFVLSDPHVHAVLTAPRNREQLDENIAAVERGPLQPGELDLMKEFGDAVYRERKWFL